MQTNRIIYDTYNARYITNHADVAKTFVMSPDFDAITKNNHTVVLGPRGCGKTTIFKMLTTPALKNWNPTTIEETLIRDSIPFLAIYIPSDELWKKQLESFSNSLGDNTELIKAVTKALITTNILSNFCKSIKDHIECMTEFDLSYEYTFAESLISEWKLSNTPKSLSAIRQSLESRKNELITKIEYSIYSKKTGKEDIKLEEYYFLDFLKSIHIACLAYERVYNRSKELKWALCFDELELVSTDFFHELVSKLRIAPSNILFKLSTGPLADFKDIISQLTHDYSIVKMWPFDIEQESKYQGFCEKIATQNILARLDSSKGKNNYQFSLNNLLGELDYSLYALKEYKFDVNINAREGEFKSLTWHVFKQLAADDITFSYFLRDNRIDQENPVPRTDLQFTTIFRKLKEIVVNRLVFNKYSDNSKTKRPTQRTRKIFPIYYGRTTVLKICEGNPRFILGLINDFFSQINLNDDISLIKITPYEQVKIIQSISDRFRSMLHTYPTTNFLGRKKIDLLWLIERIGLYAQNEINVNKMRSNPVSCFYVDDKTPKSIIELIKIGVDLGAFMKIDNSGQILDGERKETRYRLSYLLAPQYKLPLRLYAATNIMNIINKSLEVEDNTLTFF